jgi:antitoxin component YwqK of YwqJK toxin-antitoxin module
MKYFASLLLLLSACSRHDPDTKPTVVSMQIIDRNNFSETISSRDRLSKFENTDFLAPQPYQKVLRIFSRQNDKSSSIITTYHPNGLLCQYLETSNGRACGLFREWHPNGKLRIEASVIEGTADVTEIAQMTWVFDGLSKVWDADGRLSAEISYSKGALENPSRYYHPNGKLAKEIPYSKDEIHGTLTVFDESGSVIEKLGYKHGLREGISVGLHDTYHPCYREVYQNGLLNQGSYFSYNGDVIAEINGGSGKQALFKAKKLASLAEFKDGKPEGEVQNFNSNGALISKYIILNDEKDGEEWHYYPTSTGPLKPKLCVPWSHDTIQGVVKTWYETGVMESQREMQGNKKHGLSFAWFKEGDLMLMEEYDYDVLIKGSYYRKWEQKPISKIENGKGIATLYDSDGHFLRKTLYEKGLPQDDPAP